MRYLNVLTNIAKGIATDLNSLHNQNADSQPTVFDTRFEFKNYLLMILDKLLTNYHLVLWSHPGF